MSQPARYPQYIPFPEPVVRKGWVPVAQSVNWPAAQFAPRYLPPGSGSVQPFIYPDGATEVLYSGPDVSGSAGWTAKHLLVAATVAVALFYGLPRLKHSMGVL